MIRSQSFRNFFFNDRSQSTNSDRCACSLGCDRNSKFECLNDIRSCLYTFCRLEVCTQKIGFIIYDMVLYKGFVEVEEIETNPFDKIFAIGEPHSKCAWHLENNCHVWRTEESSFNGRNVFIFQLSQKWLLQWFEQIDWWEIHKVKVESLQFFPTEISSCNDRPIQEQVTESTL